MLFEKINKKVFQLKEQKNKPEIAPYQKKKTIIFVFHRCSFSGVFRGLKQTTQISYHDFFK